MTARIDFNCDLGEGCGDDAAIVPCISSASIATGGHAGDARSMREAIALCLRHGVAVGAHPSFLDREHFGRRELSLPPADVHALVRAQIEQLAVLCVEAGTTLAHVKPHGALYNLAARDAASARAVAQAVFDCDPRLWLYALAGSELARAGAALGLAVAQEVFAERAYAAGGGLVPRAHPGAVIEDLDAALAQVRGMLRNGIVTSIDGHALPIRADTLCLHGDRADAAAFATALRDALRAEGFAILSPATRIPHA